MRLTVMGWVNDDEIRDLQKAFVKIILVVLAFIDFKIDIFYYF